MFSVPFDTYAPVSDSAAGIYGGGGTDAGGDCSSAPVHERADSSLVPGGHDGVRRGHGAGLPPVSAGTDLCDGVADSGRTAGTDQGACHPGLYQSSDQGGIPLAACGADRKGGRLGAENHSGGGDRL